MAPPSFTTAPGTDPALVVTDAMIRVEHELNDLPVTSAMQLIEFCRNRLAASEARLLADRYENGASDRQVEDLVRSESNTSKNEAKKRASRAKAAHANPDIASRMKSGTLNAEQADVIAKAAEETDGAAACDADLINEVANTSPEQGAKKAKKFVNDRRNADDIQTRHDKQHRQRGWYRHRLSNGNSAITFHGTDEKIDEIERNVVAGADREYQADGGRDVPRSQHPRTNDQRGFDGAHKLITTEEEAPETSAGQTSKPRSSRPASTRQTLHINAIIDQVAGNDPSPFTTADGKPLPRSVVDEIACGCNIIGHIFSADGELLWQTRKQRLATPAQINGLIARDGGCVLCDAHHSVCVAHHRIPWEAPAKGETDIDNLVLLCGDCHSRVHQRKWTLFYDPKPRPGNIGRPSHTKSRPTISTTIEIAARRKTQPANIVRIWRLPENVVAPNTASRWPTNNETTSEENCSEPAEWAKPGANSTQGAQPNTAARSWACSWAWMRAEPVDGLPDSGREKR